MFVSRDEFVRKARAFRARADEVRAAAEEMRNPSARLAMLQIAERYEIAARHLEASHVGDDPAERQAC
jgi:hypothetical protein